MGSSPLTRGKLCYSVVSMFLGGLIPAHAGKTVWLTMRDCTPCGSSPLTRGKLRDRVLGAGVHRLIPAHAGKTSSCTWPTTWWPAHPRSRGENTMARAIDALPPGSSPLTRGKPAQHFVAQLLEGLIPAHAGKTSPGRRSAPPSRAHPRSRGENGNEAKVSFAKPGSSPLTRGKQTRWALSDLEQRLIPAHAGKTRSPNRPRRRGWAHPRSRGENHGHRSKPPCPSGSSPLTRGKPTYSRSTDLAVGLIPAHAGKTSGPGALNGHLAGSSPLTRGKRGGLPRDRYVGGLIPAHAGKTISILFAMMVGPAHPRSRGENVPATGAPTHCAGSSPLTRGKQVGVVPGGAEVGLIPAHAGKTWSPRVATTGTWAHPRSRGENPGAPATSGWSMGSSPLTRGKRRLPAPVRRRPGLIPAHAGKTPST